MNTEFFGVFARTAGSLLLVLGLLICLLYLLKRIRLRSLSLNAYPEMRVIGTLSLAPKRALALVELCDQWLVLGVGTESITLISKMDRPPEPSAAERMAQGGGKGFHALLQSAGLWRQGQDQTAGGKHEAS